MDKLYGIALGPAVILSLMVTGGYFCVRLGLAWFLHPRRTLRLMCGNHGKRETFCAVTMALAGTLGVGNIAGVALALLIGGAGSLFWMLLSAFFAMAVKYAEVLLAMDTRLGEMGKRQGGAMFYMRGHGIAGRILPSVFAFLCTLCAVLQGSVIQGSAAAEAISLSIGIKPLFGGVLLSCIAFVIISFGCHGIARVTAVAIPAATILYMGMCLTVLVLRAEMIPAALTAVFRGVLNPDAGVGGIAGYLLSVAARQGCAKGLLSNEAGCGTAPMAHITSEGTTPVGQALWGVFEVFLDTVIICTLTGLTCLCVSPSGSADAPIAYILSVFTPFFGEAAKHLIAICIVIFAFSTTLTWSYYGAASLTYLTRSPLIKWSYLFLYCLALTIGACGSADILYTLTDILLAVMTLINLPILAKKADRVISLSAEEGLISINRIHGCAPALRHRRMQDERGSPHTRAR